MPLITCPDCSKEISDRVEACPFCGCPAKYFERKQADNNTVPVQTADEKLSPQKEEEPIFKFRLFDYELSYPESVAPFATLFGEYTKKASEAVSEISDEYSKAGNIDNVLNKVIPLGNKILDSVIEEVIAILYKYDINYSVGQFKGEYEDIYDFNYLCKCDIVKRLNKESEQLRVTLEQEERIRRASRGKWQGGGFGVKGAIKGAITASALNVGSDILHSFGDASRASAINATVNADKRSTYNAANVRFTVCVELGYCIMNVFWTLARILEANKILSIPNIDSSEALVKFGNANKYAKTDEEKYPKQLIECIMLYPAEKQFYDALMPYIVSYSSDDLAKWFKFWNIEYLFPNYEKEREIGGKFDAEWTKIMQEERQYIQSPKAESYVATREFCVNFYKKNGIDGLPNYSFHSAALKEYYWQIGRDYPSFMGRFLCIDWIPIVDSIEEFMKYINWERESLPASYLPWTWILGDDIAYLQDEDISRRSLLRTIVEENNKIIFCLDTSKYRNGTSGLVLTEKEIIDLKSKKRFRISDVTYIAVTDDASIEVATECDYIHIASEDFEVNASFYIMELIQIICVRFYGNSTLWNDKMTNTVKPNTKMCDKCGKRIPLSAKFCNFCGQILDPNIHECASCGKIINVGIKFCNFCGAKNEQ